MKLSIIVPVYNVEKYIERCIHSLLDNNIDSTVYEIIIVNDCTPDNSMEIIHRIVFENKNINFKIINNSENQSLGGSRNIGIEEANGEYLMFLDSDDWVEKNALDEIFKKIDEKYDLILLNVVDVYTNEIKVSHYNKFNLEKDNLLMKFSPTAWSKIYKKEFFKDIKFPKYIYHEDTAIWPQIVYKTKKYNKIAHIEKVLINYECRNQTSITKKFNKKVIDDYVEVFKVHDEWLKKENIIDEYISAIFIFQYQHYVNCKNRLRWHFNMEKNSVLTNTEIIKKYLIKKNKIVFQYLDDKEAFIESTTSRKLYFPIRVFDKIYRKMKG